MRVQLIMETEVEELADLDKATAFLNTEYVGSRVWTMRSQANVAWYFDEHNALQMGLFVPGEETAPTEGGND